MDILEIVKKEIINREKLHIYEHIDYNRVNKLLNKERKKSYKFLKEALND